MYIANIIMATSKAPASFCGETLSVEILILAAKCI